MAAPRGHLPALAPCMLAALVLLAAEHAAGVEVHGVEVHGVEARPVADFFPELADPRPRLSPCFGRAAGTPARARSLMLAALVLLAELAAGVEVHGVKAHGIEAHGIEAHGIEARIFPELADPRPRSSPCCGYPRGHLSALAPCMLVLLGPELAASVGGHGVESRPSFPKVSPP